MNPSVIHAPNGAHRVLVALLTFGGTACGALDEFEQVIVDEARLPQQTNPGPFSPDFGGSLDDLNLSTAEEFQNNNVSPDDVDAIFVKSLVIETDGGTPTLSIMSTYLSRVEFYVQADGVPRQTLGVLTEIPDATSAVIPVDPTLNLKPFAVAPSMQVGADIELRVVPFVDVTIRTTLTLLVDINLLGA